MSWSDYPERIVCGARSWLRDDGLVAMPGDDEADDPIERIAAPPFTIHRSQDAALRAADGARPLYRARPDDAPGVPTGLILLRLHEAVPVEGLREDLSALGYAIERLLDYAPQAAWLRHHSGDPAIALRAAQGLATLPDLASCDVQLLLPRASRQDGRHSLDTRGRWRRDRHGRTS